MHVSSWNLMKFLSELFDDIPVGFQNFTTHIIPHGESHGIRIPIGKSI